MLLCRESAIAAMPYFVIPFSPKFKCCNPLLYFNTLANTSAPSFQKVERERERGREGEGGKKKLANT